MYPFTKEDRRGKQTTLLDAGIAGSTNTTPLTTALGGAALACQLATSTKTLVQCGPDLRPVDAP